MSQREVAAEAEVGQSTVARAESGSQTPSLDVVSRILAATGHRLVVVDADGHVLRPLNDLPGIHDQAGRRYPAHLRVVLGSISEPWWRDQYGFYHPPDSFQLEPEMRAYRRAYSAWQIRKKRHLHEPEPQKPPERKYEPRYTALDRNVPDHLELMLDEERRLSARAGDLTREERAHLEMVRQVLDRVRDLLVRRFDRAA